MASGLAALAKSHSYSPGSFGGRVSPFEHPARRPQNALFYPDKIVFQAGVPGPEEQDGCGGDSASITGA